MAAAEGGCPSPENFTSPATLGHLFVPSALQRCRAGDAVGSPQHCARTGAPWGGVLGSLPKLEGRRSLSAVLPDCPGPPVRRRREAGGPVCKYLAGGGHPPPPPTARIKVLGGAPRRSRCLPGAGRALRPRARPQPARAAPRLRVRTRGIGDPRRLGETRAPRPGVQREPPASSWSLRRCPALRFLCGNQRTGASAAPSPGPGRCHLPRLCARPVFSLGYKTERNCVRCMRG